MVQAQLTWMNKRGAGCMETGEAARLAKKLETLRCEATLRTLDGEVIGGCEPTNGAQDDKRIKWNWWYDRSAL